MTDKETIALLSQIIAETAEELGCENDNEAILQAIHDLKQRASLPSPPVSGEPVAWLRDAHNGKGDECLVPCAKGDLGGFPVYASPLTNEPVGQFDTSDYVIVGSDGKPRRNEPVGVTEWRIKDFADGWFWTDDPAQVEKAKSVGATVVPLRALNGAQ